jgi:three-Cys-motif partner protein
LLITFGEYIIHTEMGLVFDKIGFWSEIKLEIIRKYASAYSKIMARQRNPELYHIYIDAFAGSGKHISKRTGDFVRGSPQIALDIDPPFREYHFIDIKRKKSSNAEEVSNTETGG